MLYPNKNMVMALDPRNRVIKRLWCIFLVAGNNKCPKISYTTVSDKILYATVQTQIRLS